MATDSSGNVYVTGYTDVGINGQSQHGNKDYFIIKYDANGGIKWVQQLGASGGETKGHGIATDSGGNVHLTGDTSVGINCQQQHGNDDYFIAVYQPDGNLIWADQVGTYQGDTGGLDIATDNSGNTYITGKTQVGINGQPQHGRTDYFVVKYNKSTRQWTQQVGGEFGPGYTRDYGIATSNSGAAYITGSTTFGINKQPQKGALDVFTASYNSDGDLFWGRQVGG